MSRNVASLSSPRECYHYPKILIFEQTLPAHKSAILQSVVIACLGVDFDSGGSAHGRRRNANSSICYCRTSIFMSSCGSEGVVCNIDTDFGTLCCMFCGVLDLLCWINAVCQNSM
jgi:hypothetical protein